VSDPRPIAVYDSGVGGLTVARAILDLLPNEPILYLGDSARMPYGPRPPAQIRGFAVEIASYLVSRDVKLIVVACNSVEVSAIDEVTASSGIPVLGVIDPGVRAALRATRTRKVGVIGTEATIGSGAYERAVARTQLPTDLHTRACPAFVDFVERGDTSSDELLALARSYLDPLRETGIDTLVLGCTHYPLLSGLIQYVMGEDVVLISSAEETAKDVYATLLDEDLQCDAPGPPAHEFLSTGDPTQFQVLAERFLGPELTEVHAALAPVGGA
jgi:glutamate racemase